MKIASGISQTRFNLTSTEISVFAYVLTVLQSSNKTLIVLNTDLVRKRLKMDRRDKLLNALKSLQTECFEYKGQGHYFRCQLISSIEWTEDDPTNVQIEISPKFSNYLLDFARGYSRIKLTDMLTLKNKYSKRLYINFSSFKGRDRYYFDVSREKSILDCENYSNFNDFSRRVLEPSISEINKHTNLMVVEVDRVKSGKKVIQIVYKVIEGVKAEMKVHDTGLLSLLGSKYRLSEMQASQIMDQLNLDEIQNALTSMAANFSEIKNIGGYAFKTFQQTGVNFTSEKFH